MLPNARNLNGRAPLTTLDSSLGCSLPVPQVADLHAAFPGLAFQWVLPRQESKGGHEERSLRYALAAAQQASGGSRGRTLISAKPVTSADIISMVVFPQRFISRSTHHLLLSLV